MDLKTREANAKSSQNGTAPGSGEIPFLTIMFTIALSRFEVQLSRSVWGLPTDSISEHVWYKSYELIKSETKMKPQK